MGRPKVQAWGLARGTVSGALRGWAWREAGSRAGALSSPGVTLTSRRGCNRGGDQPGQCTVFRAAPSLLLHPSGCHNVPEDTAPSEPGASSRWPFPGAPGQAQTASPELLFAPWGGQSHLPDRRPQPSRGNLSPQVESAGWARPHAPGLLERGRLEARALQQAQALCPPEVTAPRGDGGAAHPDPERSLPTCGLRALRTGSPESHACRTQIHPLPVATSSLGSWPRSSPGRGLEEAVGSTLGQPRTGCGHRWTASSLRTGLRPLPTLQPPGGPRGPGRTRAAPASPAASRPGLTCAGHEAPPFTQAHGQGLRGGRSHSRLHFKSKQTNKCILARKSQ